MDSESKIKEKRGGRDIGQFVVFVLAPCCWDDNFELELVSFMTIWCQMLVGNEKELEGHEYAIFIRLIKRVFWRSSEFLAPNEWWLSNRAIRDIAPLTAANPFNKYRIRHFHPMTSNSAPHIWRQCPCSHLRFILGLPTTENASFEISREWIMAFYSRFLVL